MTLKEQWLDEAVRVTLGHAFCKSVWGNSQPHNHLGILVTMPETVKCIRLEYNRIADRACEEFSTIIELVRRTEVWLPTSRGFPQMSWNAKQRK